MRTSATHLRRVGLAGCLLLTTGCSTVADFFGEEPVLDTGIEPVALDYVGPTYLVLGHHPQRWLRTYDLSLAKLDSIELPHTDNPDASRQNELVRNYYGAVPTSDGVTFVKWHDGSEWYEGRRPRRPTGRARRPAERAGQRGHRRDRPGDR